MPMPVTPRLRRSVTVSTKKMFETDGPLESPSMQCLPLRLCCQRRNLLTNCC